MDFLTVVGSLIIGFVVGGLTGIFGVGGGFLMTPALIIFLGIPAPVAVGTDLATIFANSSFGIIKRKGTKTVDLKLASILSIGSILGVLAGSYLLEYLKEVPVITLLGKQLDPVQYVLLWLFLILLTWIAWQMYSDYRKNGHKGDEDHQGVLTRVKIPPYAAFDSIGRQRLPLIVLIGVGFGIGTLTGLMGIGGGVILLPALIYLVGQKTNKAAGTSLAIVWVSSLFGVFTKGCTGDINPYLLIVLLVGGLSGTFLGTRIGLKCHSSKMKLYFVFVVLVAIVMIAYKIAAVMI